MADDSGSKRGQGTYTQDEVNEILQRALEVQGARQNQLRHDELVEIAGEVGIDRDALDAALADMAQRRTTELTTSAEKRELAAERRRRWRAFLIHFASFALTNAILYDIDRRLTGGMLVYWVILGWGIGLIAHFLHLVMPSPGWEEKHLRKKARRAKRQAQIEAARDRWESVWRGKWDPGADPQVAREWDRQNHGRKRRGDRPGNPAIERGAREFERAVEDGVAALLNVAARKIREHAAGAGGAPREAAPSNAQSPTRVDDSSYRPSPRTRVDANEGYGEESAEPDPSRANRGASR